MNATKLKIKEIHVFIICTILKKKKLFIDDKSRIKVL